MKIKHLIYVTPLLVLMSGAAFGQNVEWSRFTRYEDGKKFTFKVTAVELQTLPSWNPETDEVPLSARQAVLAARTSLPGFLSKPDKWTLNRIELTPMTKDKWIYEIYFDCTTENCGRPDSDWSFMIFVKMDGSIVEPEIEPWNGKGKVY